MGTTVLASAITCLVTLVITTLFNWFIHKPKRARAEKAEQEKRRQEDKEEILEEIHSLGKEVRAEMEEQKGEIMVLRLGMQASLKNDLKIRYDSWLKKGYAPIDAKDDLERMYQIYHSLGANGVMDEHRNKFLALPDTKKPKELDGHRDEKKRKV